MTKRCDDLKKDTNKKTKAILKELEKLQGNLDRKCNLDEFNSRLESKLDRQTANSLINSRPSHQEIEPILNTKAEIVEVQQMLQTLELKFEDEFQAINDHLSRKASVDDLAFYRKETQFKADNEALDDLR